MIGNPLAGFFSRRTLLADRLLHATPEGLGMECREVTFPSAGGVSLSGWLVPGRKRGTIVLCSGNGGNVSAHLEYAMLAAGTGYSVLCFDYRGYGRSEGEPDLRHVAADAEAACAHARSLAPGAPVGAFGLSLGAGAALLAAARGGASAVAVEGVSDTGWMLRGLLGEGSFGPLRVRAIEGPDGASRPRARIRLIRRTLGRPLAACMAPLLAAFFPYDAKSLRRSAAGLPSTSVFIAHGIDDLLLPFEGAIDLHRILRGPKSLWLIPDCGHAQEPILCASKEYAARLERFFDGAFGGGEAPGPAGRPLFVREERGILRLSYEDGSGPEVIPIEAVEVAADDRARAYREGGYRGTLRNMTRAVNQRDLAALDRAIGEHLALERAYPFDFLAALQCLTAARAALGRSLDWPARDPAIARRSLERLLQLRDAHEMLPGADVEASPSAWALRELGKT